MSHCTWTLQPSVSFLLQRMKVHHKPLYRHALRVGADAGRLGMAFGMEGEELERLINTALLMDAGKLRYPAPVLERFGQGSKQEELDYFRHPLYSCEVLSALIDQGLVDGEAVELHHEHLDGTGFPHGVDERSIPLMARILRVVDTYHSDLGFHFLESFADCIYDGSVVECYRRVLASKDGVLHVMFRSELGYSIG